VQLLVGDADLVVAAAVEGDVDGEAERSHRVLSLAAFAASWWMFGWRTMFL
jgi:hypothetical protein